MPETERGIYYPYGDGPVDVAGDMTSLAESVEAALDDIRPVNMATQTSASSTTSATFVAPTNAVSATFVAPSTGRVVVLFKGETWSTSGYGTVIGAEIRTGTVVGSGSQVLAASDNDAVRSFGDARQQGASFLHLSGFTPGADYHVRLMMRVTTAGQTANLERGKIIVLPA